MAKRKQKRRRQKERRHEWEYVYVDDEGNEVEVDPGELTPAKATKVEQRAPGKASSSKRKSQQLARRPGRTIDPPSWRRVGKRALLVGPVVVIAMLLLNPHVPVAQRLVPAVVMLAFFLPFSYFTDSVAYRMYRKRMDRVAGTGKS